MKKVYRGRLERLATFLEELPPARFDFGDVVKTIGELEDLPPKGRDRKIRDIDSDKLALRKCGYVGCAIGFLPFVFPRQFKIGDRKLNGHTVNGHTVCLRAQRDGDCFYAAQMFFGLGMDEIDCLFVPGYGGGECYGCKCLGTDATPKQLARNIRNFIKWKEKEGAV